MAFLQKGKMVFIILRQVVMNQGVRTMKCPFDPAHIMPYERFLNHLQKCQFPNKKQYRKCKFNPYHVLHQNELQEHQNSCPGRKKFEADDDDWGVAEQQQQKPTFKQTLDEKIDLESYASLNTNATSKNTGGAKKYKKYVPPSNSKLSQSSSGIKSVDVNQNSLMQVQDLQIFNAPGNRKRQ